MSINFEKQKNVQASAITFGVTLALLIALFLVKWSLPVKEKIPVEEYIEISLNEDPNLGNSDVGSGNTQPIITGTAGGGAAQAEAQAAASNAQPEPSRDVETDDNNSDAPPIIKPTITKPDATKINTETKAVKTPTPAPAPVEAPRKPKTVVTRTLGSGTGNGGNTDLPGYNRGGSEGPGDGAGDKGPRNGNPNGTGYTGTPRNLGVRVINMPAQTFEDDFKEGGKIALDVQVNESGKLVSANYSVSGSSLARSSKQYEIALRRAREISWPKYEGGFKQKVTFSFSVR
jgi:hypothetical protein